MHSDADRAKKRIHPISKGPVLWTDVHLTDVANNSGSDAVSSLW